MLLSEFHSTRPRFEITQEAALDWLAIAHAEAEASLRSLDGAAKTRFAGSIARVLRRIACQPDKIRKRGHSVADIGAACWDDGELYNVRTAPRGKGAEARTQLFGQLVDAYFETEYSAERRSPDDLVHVSCTGYLSPNGAQKLVARRGWGSTTRVTNAYHMGCFAAIPALRIASGFVAMASRRVDIVHTELCSLHFQPANHALDQLVVQSLFADGLIRYSMTTDHGGAGLRELAVHEQILADSAGSMTWIAGDAGMQMTLARDVPDRIAKGVRGFVLELFARGGAGLEHMKRSMFAVHPGGPKIIDQVRKMLELDEAQVAESRRVLYDFGNMSSATLPHVWMRMLADPAVPAGTIIPSLAFGPGLTMCGVLLEKR
ncbi:MAG: 3-oxoacyl-[acyl-carrier-protein] synthase III C-terminal domain-containing protein [Kofleriaceae bacterium]